MGLSRPAHPLSAHPSTRQGAPQHPQWGAGRVLELLRATEARGAAAREAAPGLRASELILEEVLDLGEGTNFDVAITLASGRQVLVEVKLTESEFRTCANDHKHQRKLTDIYMNRLAGKVAPEVLEEEAFVARYQILRNVSYAGETTEVVFAATVVSPMCGGSLRNDQRRTLGARQQVKHAVKADTQLQRNTGAHTEQRVRSAR
ncbi:MAG: PGN_0703 family putative restriction endonuclease [Gemmatimonadaceae bacterium]